MVSTTGDYSANVFRYPFIHSWVTGPPVLASFSLKLPIPLGTILKGGLMVVRNPSAAYRKPRTERRSEAKVDTVSREIAPLFTEVRSKSSKLKGNRSFEQRYTAGN